ncbi:glycine cleavage system protein R [Aromatoleum buckelii]|uniref:ACT domain-containing protein n=1 Tax=Aromatoleum buckelii TaxID=200254 RepID=A0ABX1MWG8_9RHOO|nr:ACT domain-containing protein [Aromatoleum buckelii]MCK0512813.1 ACT domain-containing protein [Aromatoleum buckelii]
MSRLLVLTVIGDDRPGLVEELSSVITAHHGNWLESSMAQLAGKFAGLLKISVPPEHVQALETALAKLSALRVMVECSMDSAAETAHRHRRLSFSLVGHDRIGIVREVSQVFARHGVNVEKLVTRTSTAPMSSETLFHAEAELKAGEHVDADALKADLERLSNDLIADINLDELVG